MAKLNIKKGDTVVVISGKDKGKTGKVLNTSPIAKKTVVDGVNIVTKHQKPKNQKDKGGIIKKPAPVDTSNLMIICSACGKATRVARKTIDGKHARVCNKCGASLDRAFVKAVKKESKKKVENKEVAEDVKETETKTKALKTTTKKATNVKVSEKKTTTAKSATVRRVQNRGK